MTASNAAKTQYSETEAAEELGVSVEKLRILIRSHIVETEEDLSKVPVAGFQPADLLLLRFLSGGVPERHSEEPSTGLHASSAAQK
jgi:hypothetical protein